MLAEEIPEWRHGPVRHPVDTPVRQRIFPAACGSPDQNDSNTLRADLLRRWLLRRGVSRLQLATLRLVQLTIGGWVQRLADQVRLH